MSFPRQGSGNGLSEYIQGVQPVTIDSMDSFVDENGEVLVGGNHPLNDANDAGTGTERVDDPSGVTSQPGSQPGSAESLQAAVEAANRRAAEAEQRLQEQEERNRQEAQRAAEAEHNRILQQISAIPDQEQREAARARYEGWKATQENKRLREENEGLRRSDEQTKVTAARNTIITHAMVTNGFPPNVRAFLEAAQSPEHLDFLVEQVRQLVPQQSAQPATQQARVQQRINSGADVAGGGVASTVPTEGPKKRSGDIMGLIQQTPYQRVATRD